MDKAIKKHFGPVAKSSAEKKALGRLLSDDKKLDRMIDQDKKKKGK